MDFLRKNSGYLIGLVVLGAFTYSFNLQNPLFWDDTDWIVNNPSLHALSWENIKFIFTRDALAGIGQVSNYYRPFLFLTFLVNYIISGISPLPYHVVNNGLHIASGLLVFALLQRWLKSKRAAFLAALLFIIHPLQTEAVTYVAGRGDPLALFFMLIGIGAFILLRENNRPILAYVLSGLLMILAILSRETAVLFPAYLALSLFAFEYGPASFWIRVKKSCQAVLPFTGIAAVYAILRLTVLNFQNTLNFYQTQNIYSENIIYRFYTFFHALLVYLRLIIFPTGLHMDRDVPISFSLAEGWAWLGFLVIVGSLAWLVYAYRQRLKSFPVWVFGMGMFFVYLAPTSGVIPINAKIYEHWLYISLIGVAAVAGWYTNRLFEWIEKNRKHFKPILVIGLVAYCGFLSIQTIRQNILWGNTEEFYKNILSHQPDDVRVLNNLANWYSDHGNGKEAASLYVRAIESNPSQPAPYYNLGNILRDNGEHAQAEELYKKSLEVDPSFHYAYRNLAGLYVRQNKIPEAIWALERLRELAPSADIDAALEQLRGSR